MQQSGTQISGELGQLIVLFTGRPPEDPRLSEADVEGELVVDPAGKHDLVILKRISRNRESRAVFAGTYDGSAGTISGTFKNRTPGGGTFVMERRQP